MQEMQRQTVCLKETHFLGWEYFTALSHTDLCTYRTLAEPQVSLTVMNGDFNVIGLHL